MPIADVTYSQGVQTGIPREANGLLHLAEPAQSGDSQQLNFSSTTAEGNVDVTNWRLACICPDVDCRVAIGAAAVATVANSRKLFGNQPRWFAVPPGHRISVCTA